MPSATKSVALNSSAKGTPEERAAYLDEVCGDDRDLRNRVEELLAADREAGSFPEADTLKIPIDNQGRW